MADGELTVTLDPTTARLLSDAAEAAGRPVETLVADLVAEHVRFSEAHRALAEYEVSAVARPAAEALSDFVQRVARRAQAD